ncbi:MULTISPECIES: ArsR/SmtB family transcription factor [Streptomyces]|uniref:ArsR/SmtB family transcription factor n=1 Tax=Streptomyces TaxID=1883 RepID=UPI0004AB16D0|nr:MULTISPECIES: helix-turn-helix domain-containing protein [Streptomyces]MCL6292522.1 helix-turn-helix domain-containing protein [Streptomyces sp. 43Y-GA-1]MDX2671222.1 helix-turn-helix domain-containing protein [Streptomyces sp. NRRL_ISP-5395]MDX3340233.1 helix-turn-helix domain-containing protein [Streptomyces sp. ME02-6979.5a]WKN13676.1 helix-turn-helix domain-containing protein [Streptomyces sp. JUS-F4]GHF76204.1 transcriptional regulator [Streptomyces griseus]
MTPTAERPEGPDIYADAVVLDAKGLRALAHPVRVQLVGVLRKHGPSTATRLAERLGVNSGTASYHLRQLGAAGFVEEDTERGNARERWWRSVHRTIRFSYPELAEREPDAALAYLQSVAAIHTLRTQQTLNGLQTVPRAWRGTFDMSDWDLRLTPEETIALDRELKDVIARYRRDDPDSAASAPEGAERVAVITQIMPEPDVPATPSSSSGPQEAEEGATP